MRSDIERWNRKYSESPLTTDLKPDPLLIQHVDLLDGQGRSLDLACGTCDNAIFLARRGYESYAVDGSFVALSRGLEKARVNRATIYPWVADLDSYPLSEHQFNVVLMIRYLSRPLIKRVKKTVAAGGRLIFKTFNTNLLKDKPSFPRDYLLRPGELGEIFDSWYCIDSNDCKDSQHTDSFWVGRKLDY